MSAMTCFEFSMTMLIVALFVFALDFKCRVTDPVLVKLLTDEFFDGNGILICNDMHCCAVVEAVKASYVYVMHIRNAVNFQNMLPDFIEAYSTGRFFEKQIKYGFEVFKNAYQDENCNCNGHNRIDENKISKSHYN